MKIAVVTDSTAYLTKEEYAEYEKECRKRFGSSLAAKDINLAAGGFGEKFDAGVIIHGKSDN